MTRAGGGVQVREFAKTVVFVVVGGAEAVEDSGLQRGLALELGVFLAGLEGHEEVLALVGVVGLEEERKACLSGSQAEATGADLTSTGVTSCALFPPKREFAAAPTAWWAMEDPVPKASPCAIVPMRPLIIPPDCAGWAAIMGGGAAWGWGAGGGGV
eukprot:CAMPEP_0197391462 /NCGR_PEP_ID=MMETSP1165-20131217/3116_1 /TAXON_ID=284809 /ORGANISM="Chrysocystis fragilis, Strain CCMP3189" /LENGTH=156 /DNA_ID=CAMNT_0042917049 /DNA_START=98 /DNA_END=569 /DNA_ORIENTATION=+